MRLCKSAIWNSDRIRISEIEIIGELAIWSEMTKIPHFQGYQNGLGSICLRQAMV